MKTCNQCFAVKPETEFYSNRAMPDGLLKQCKACTAARQKAYKKTEAGKESKRREQIKHAAKYRVWKTAYKKTEKGRASAKRAGQTRQQMRPERNKAKCAVYHALITGKLVRQPCFVCGGKGVAHHSSYASDMKLCVTWLCVSHHNELHNPFNNQ